jgi:hypothetical protein
MKESRAGKPWRSIPIPTTSNLQGHSLDLVIVQTFEGSIFHQVYGKIERYSHLMGYYQRPSVTGLQSSQVD